MKKTITILLAVITLGSCGVDRTKSPNYKSTDDRLFVVEFDGCEYIENSQYGNILAHKGNCKNKIHYK